MKKIFAMITMIILSTVMAFGESGASEALNQEIIGMSKTAGLVLFVFMILSFIVVPLGGAFFAKGLAKKKAEQNGDEAGGLMTMVWAMGGGIIGFFAVFIIIGFMGSMMDADATEGEVNLVQGNRHVISKVLGSLLTNTQTSLQ